MTDRIELIQVIHKKMSHLNEDELMGFCQTFYPDTYYNRLSSGMTHGHRIRLIIEDAERYGEGLKTLYQQLEETSQSERSKALKSALTQFQQMPKDVVPEIANLPIGSLMPHPINPIFVGRQIEMVKIAKSLKSGLSVAINQVVPVLTGMGGIGKTQLAASFARRYGQYFAGGVYWISFANPDMIPNEIASCSGAVKMPLEKFLSLDEPTRVQLVQRAWEEPIPRLLIFDNCENPTLLNKWRPKMGGSCVLITSRRGQWEKGLGIKTISLNVLPLSDSLALLRKLSPQLNNKEAISIAEALGKFPLALYLAGSYLGENSSRSASSFLKQLEKKKLYHQALEGKGLDYLPMGHTLSVSLTFEISWEQLVPSNFIDNLAIQVMALTGQFAPDEPIPESLLLLCLSHIDNEILNVNFELEDHLFSALRRLRRLGLLPVKAIRAHRMIRFFVQDRLGVETWQKAQNVVESTLLQESTRINQAGQPPDLRTWRNHLIYVVDNALEQANEQSAMLSMNLGYHLKEEGDLMGAKKYYKQSLEIMEMVVGLAPHPKIAICHNALGLLLQAIGEYEQAKSNYSKALQIRKQLFGINHPDTAQTLNNYGFLLAEMGDYKDAQQYYEQSLFIRREVLGVDHSDTAISLNNLATLLQKMGDYKTAYKHYEQSLSIQIEQFGKHHLQTAISLNNMGGLLRTIGDYETAKSYLEQALDIRIDILGLNHATTATSLNDLGVLFETTKQYAQAREHFEQSHKIYEENLGANHPWVAISLNNIGRVLHGEKKYNEALIHLERALTIYEKSWGLNHPWTATGLHNLGRLHRSMDNYEKSWLYLAQALSIREELLGIQHVSTARTMYEIGKLLNVNENYVESQKYYERALPIFKKNLGQEHHDTINLKNDLQTIKDVLS